MSVTLKSEVENLNSGDSADISIGQLLAALGDHVQKPLLFYYNGRPIRLGYHVTEVKAGQFSALDCGANAEAWTEIFVQLLDGHEDRAHMAAGKFSAIIRKVMDHVQLDPQARLTFEVSDGVKPMQLFCAAMPEAVAGEVHVALSPRPASCKPRDRWLEQDKQKSASCCGPSAGAAKTCCAA